MARVLHQEIKDMIRDDNQLASDYCDQMGVKIVSLDQMLRRDNRTLTHADNIHWLSQRLNKSLDEILTQPEPETESQTA